MRRSHLCSSGLSITLCIFLIACPIPSVAEIEWLDGLRRRLGVETSKEPAPIVVENFISEKDAATILQRYERLLRSSVHMVKSKASQYNNYRTSTSVRLPPLGDSLIVDVERRAARLAGNYSHSYAEDFQLACYEEGQLYGLHRDDADVPGHPSADRAASVLIYLRSPEEGGETLFTRRPLEDERDMDTKRALQTEEGGLKLFRHYCNRPKKRFLAVPPTVGSAVTWPNWYGEDNERFAARSTHGACPVKKGRKCAIQVWISKTNKLPLRDERVAAIFPAGADASFDEKGIGLPSNAGEESTVVLARGSGDDAQGKSSRCFSDVSSREGTAVPQLCYIAASDDSLLVRLDKGPYSGVGSWRIAAGALEAQVPSRLYTSDRFSVSVWVKGMDVGTVLFDLRMPSAADGTVDGNQDDASIITLSAVVTDTQQSKQMIELSSSNGNTSLLEINHRGCNRPMDHKWLWVSASLDPVGESFSLKVYGWDGSLLGESSLHGQFPSPGTCPESECTSISHGRLTLLSQPPRFKSNDGESNMAFIPSKSLDVAFIPSKSLDVAFILFHEGVLTEKELVSLRHQVMRYDVNA